MKHQPPKNGKRYKAILKRLAAVGWIHTIAEIDETAERGRSLGFSLRRSAWQMFPSFMVCMKAFGTCPMQIGSVFTSFFGLLVRTVADGMDLLSEISMKTMFVCLFTIALCGCGPSAKQLAEQQKAEQVKQQAEQARQKADRQQARQKFREAVAAMKICTQGATYNEFREKRLALETCYVANQAALADESKEIEHLMVVMKSTDVLWEFQIQWPHSTLSHHSEEWDAMLIINPAVAEKADPVIDENYNGPENYPDFYAENYVRLGLTRISKECDELLLRLTI